MTSSGTTYASARQPVGSMTLRSSENTASDSGGGSSSGDFMEIFVRKGNCFVSHSIFSHRMVSTDQAVLLILNDCRDMGSD